jgi:hypothetical protein
MCQQNTKHAQHQTPTHLAHPEVLTKDIAPQEVRTSNEGDPDEDVHYAVSFGIFVSKIYCRIASLAAFSRAGTRILRNKQQLLMSNNADPKSCETSTNSHLNLEIQATRADGGDGGKNIQIKRILPPIPHPQGRNIFNIYAPPPSPPRDLLLVFQDSSFHARTHTYFSL